MKHPVAVFFLPVYVKILSANAIIHKPEICMQYIFKIRKENFLSKGEGGKERENVIFRKIVPISFFPLTFFLFSLLPVFFCLKYIFYIIRRVGNEKINENIASCDLHENGTNNRMYENTNSQKKKNLGSN